MDELTLKTTYSNYSDDDTVLNDGYICIAIGFKEACVDIDVLIKSLEAIKELQLRG